LLSPGVFFDASHGAVVAAEVRVKFGPELALREAIDCAVAARRARRVAGPMCHAVSWIWGGLPRRREDRDGPDRR